MAIKRGSDSADFLTATAENDLIFGNGGSDEIFGGRGNDLIFGGNGDDSIDAGAGNDVVFGGLGRDLVYGGAGNDDIDGEAGNDDLWGDAGNDTVNGGAGSDEISGNGDQDKLYGDAGNDRLWGDGERDTLVGGAGNDTLYGGVANDSYLFNGKGSNIEQDIIRDSSGSSDRVKFDVALSAVDNFLIDDADEDGGYESLTINFINGRSVVIFNYFDNQVETLTEGSFSLSAEFEDSPKIPRPPIKVTSELDPLSMLSHIGNGDVERVEFSNTTLNIHDILKSSLTEFWTDSFEV